MTNDVQLVLLIGITKESLHWSDEFIASLKNIFHTDDILFIDLPGSGERLDEKSPLSIDGIVQSTRDFYHKKLHQEKKRILISISMGAMVGTKWCQLFPDDFHRFVGINASFKNLSTFYKRVRPLAILQFFSIFLTSDITKRENKIVKLCSNDKNKHDTILKAWIKVAQMRSMSRLNIIRQLIAAASYKMDFKIKPKALIIAAIHDRLAHYSCSEELQKFWGSEIKLLSNKEYGHALHIDAPLEVAQAIKEWLD